MRTLKKSPVTFPLRLARSIRQRAEEFSEREGVSLNQFINLAVAEKVSHLQHEAWLASRPKPNQAMISRALLLLDRPTGNAPDQGDELPKGYVPLRKRKIATKMDTTNPS